MNRSRGSRATWQWNINSRDSVIADVRQKTMRAHWTEIESWLKANAPAIYEGLNPPASAQQVADAEKALGVRFPADCVASFQIHNGQKFDSPWLFDAWELLSLERIVDEWKVWKDLLDRGDFRESRSVSFGATVDDWWSPLWIPLTYDGAGNHDCLDLSPGPEGRSGQIIKMWHDDVERTVMAPSYEAWFSGFASDLKNGRCKFSEEYNGVIRDEE